MVALPQSDGPATGEDHVADAQCTPGAPRPSAACLGSVLSYREVVTEPILVSGEEQGAMLIAS